MKINFFISFTILCIACNKVKHFNSIITGDAEKYWFRYYKDTAKPYLIGYSFNDEGTYIIYCNLQDSTGISRAIVDSHDNIEKKWKIVDDSTMMIGKGRFYKILFISGDSIILSNSTFPDENLKLHKENDQKVRPRNLIYWDTNAPPTM